MGARIYVPVSVAESRIPKRFDVIPSGTLCPNADEIEYLQRLVKYKVFLLIKHIYWGVGGVCMCVCTITTARLFLCVCIYIYIFLVTINCFKYDTMLSCEFPPNKMVATIWLLPLLLDMIKFSELIMFCCHSRILLYLC